MTSNKYHSWTRAFLDDIQYVLRLFISGLLNYISLDFVWMFQQFVPVFSMSAFYMRLCHNTLPLYLCILTRYTKLLSHLVHHSSDILPP